MHYKIEKCGEFVEFLDNEATFVEQDGTKFYHIKQKVKYADKIVDFELNFDRNDKLIGFYLTIND